MVVEFAEDTHRLSLCLTVENTTLTRVLAAGWLWPWLQINWYRLVLGANAGTFVGLLRAVTTVGS